MQTRSRIGCNASSVGVGVSDHSHSHSHTQTHPVPHVLLQPVARSSVRCRFMRSKPLLLVLLCLLGTCVFYLMVGLGEPAGVIAPASDSGQSVSLTAAPAHLRQEPPATRTRLVRGDQQDSESERILQSLGFTPTPRSYPSHCWRNVSLPVFSSCVQSAQAELAVAFIHRFQFTFPSHHLILHTIALDDDEFDQVNRSCSLNSTVCSVRRFDLDQFPSHVSDLKLSAFRPIMIQQVLDQAGAVVWLDLNMGVWGAESAVRLKAAVAAAAGPAVYAWTMEQPTSALTHPGMFPFFQTDKQNFFFHRMVDPAGLILFNTRRVHDHLMLPWIRCALLSECISPIGAQSSGCRFDKKPLYRYSGCHFYDMSALNVVLGLMFDFDSKPYSGTDENRFFSKIDADAITNDADGSDYELEKRNMSSPAPKLLFNRSGWHISQ